jgi:hypothetical protein
MNFTARIIETYTCRRKEMEGQYETIMNKLIDSQLSDAHIAEILENLLKSDKQFKSNTFEFYLTLKLQPLFESGIWLKTSEGHLIDFSLPMEHIKKHQMRDGIYLHNIWEGWFKTEPILKKFHMHLIELFPDATVQSPCCYWYEQSQFLEIKFLIIKILPLHHLKPT